MHAQNQHYKQKYRKVSIQLWCNFVTTDIRDFFVDFAGTLVQTIKQEITVL